MKKKLYSTMVCGALLLGVGVSPVIGSFVGNDSNVVYAIDNFGNNKENTDTGNVETNNQTNNETNTNTQQQPGNDVSDTLKGYKAVDKEDMEQARKSSAWLTNLIGVAISFLIIATFAFIGLITALDVLYLSFPPVRGFLYTAGTDGTGGMSGMNMSGTNSIGSRQWVSDEAVQVASMLGGSAQANGHGSPMGMGMGMPMGGPMGMTGAQSHQKQQGGGRVAIGVYVQKRVVFLVLLGLATVLLFTSAFTDFGINVGGMLLNVLSVIADKLSSISFG